MTVRSAPRWGRGTVLAACAALLLSGCGTRLSAEEIRGQDEVTTVSLDAESLAELKAATAPAAVTGEATATVPDVSAETSATAPRRTGETTPRSSRPAAAPPAATAPTTAGAPVKAAAAPARCTGQEAPIPIGQVGTFSGVGGAITASARTALAVWVRTVNDRGGLGCHPVRLHSVDDGMDPAKTSAAVAQLVSKHNVVALVGTLAPATINGLVDGVEKAQIPVVGGDGVGHEWNSNKWLFPQGGSFEPVIEERLKYGVGMGKSKIGLLYCVEAGACTEVADVAPKLAKRAGAEIVMSSPVSITQTDFTAQCQNAKNAGAQALLLGVDGSSIGRVARSCASLAYTPLLIANGLLISATQAKDPGIRANQLLTTTANAPWLAQDTPGQKEYAAAMARYSPGTALDAATMVAWSAGKLFEAAMRRAGTEQITTRDVLTGLGKIRDETLNGLSAPLTFTAGQAGAPVVRCAYVELLTADGWTAPQGSKPICTKK